MKHRLFFSKGPLSGFNISYDIAIVTPEYELVITEMMVYIYKDVGGNLYEHNIYGPAIYSKDGKIKEYWIDGVRIK